MEGKLLLGEDGLVYKVDDPETRIPILNSIVSISGGASHSLFVNSDGNVYSMGTGDLGQLGNGGLSASSVPTLVKTSDGAYLENCYEVSAGYKTSMAVSMDRNCICLWR